MDSLEFHPSRSARAKGRRPARPLTGPRAGSRRRARKEGGRYPAHRAQSRAAGLACGGCQKKASILPGLGRRLGLCHYYVAGLPTERSRQEAEARLHPQALPGRVSPGAARGRGSPGRRPRIPTPPRQPIRVVTSHELRPRGLRGGGGGCGVTGFQLRRPGDPGDKSLQPAARLQCESHPPRHLLQQPRSGEGRDKLKIKKDNKITVEAGRPRSRPLCLWACRQAGRQAEPHPAPTPAQSRRPAWTGPAAPSALTDNLLELIRVPADGPADRLSCRGRGWSPGRSRSRGCRRHRSRGRC